MEKLQTGSHFVSPFLYFCRCLPQVNQITKQTKLSITVFKPSIVISLELFWLSLSYTFILIESNLFHRSLLWRGGLLEWLLQSSIRQLTILALITSLDWERWEQYIRLHYLMVCFLQLRDYMTLNSWRNNSCELTILGRLRHYHLLPLLGFCIERKKKILVYKYMSNGNLYDWLHSLEDDFMKLEWPLRVRIVFGLARGLAWLHHKCKIRIVHLNICSKCILFDQNSEPQISNFERATSINSKNADHSRSSSINNGIWDLKYVTKDVYDFGIVLLELITQWLPSQISHACIISNLLASSSCLYKMIDKSLVGNEWIWWNDHSAH